MNVWAREKAPMLFTTDAEPHSSAEIDPQRRIANNLVVTPVQKILGIYISADARCQRIPSSRVDQYVSGSMIEAESVKVCVCSSVNKARGKFTSPMLAEIVEKQSRGVPGTVKQGLARAKYACVAELCRGAGGGLQNLC